MIVGLGEDLRLAHQPAKGSRVDDAVAIALIESAIGMRGLVVSASPALARLQGVGSENGLLALTPVRRLGPEFVTCRHAKAPRSGRQFQTGSEIVNLGFQTLF